MQWSLARNKCSYVLEVTGQDSIWITVLLKFSKFFLSFAKYIIWIIHIQLTFTK